MKYNLCKNIFIQFSKFNFFFDIVNVLYNNIDAKIRFANVDLYLFRNLQCCRSRCNCVQHFFCYFISTMYYINNNFFNFVVIVFDVFNEILLIVFARVFVDMNFEKTNVFFIIDVTFALIFFEFDFVNYVSIANKCNFYFLFRLFIVF